MTKPASDTQPQVTQGEMLGEPLLVPRYLTRFQGHTDRCVREGCTGVATEGRDNAQDAIQANLVHFGELHQAALRLSCREVARLALLPEDGLALEALAASFEARPSFSGPLDLSEELQDEVRSQVYQILLTQELELPRRLAVLGVFCQRLTELLESGKSANLQGLIQATDALVANEALQIPLMPLVQRRDVQAKLVGHFLLFVRNLPLTGAQRAVFDGVIAGLGFSAEGLADADRMNQGLDSGQERLAMALARRPEFLEHFLQNEIFREIFPWGDKSPLAHYAQVLRRFTLLRMLLIGRAASQVHPLDDEALVETVQVFCQVLESAGDLSGPLGEGVTGLNWEHLGILLLLV